MTSPAYPHGVMLEIYREGTPDAYGDLRDADGRLLDRYARPSHSIGPCAISWITTEIYVDGEIIEITAQVTAPAGSDVRFADRVKVNGRPFRIVGDILIPRNSFTGWSPGVRFRIAHGF
ncbi:hypothetical protein [Nocardia transvalensis]|uniref:hypothetical protein n=1 Tax=Nocardia transvalensis TaxID=37333 RepID=UPI001894EBA2|nr:hypothetical protein [Nocardia transvalensis]MBF6333327.1 hypothetical protein [Nocardia transvalensis]